MHTGAGALGVPALPSRPNLPEDPHNSFQNLEEGQRAFVHLLRKTGVDGNWTWDQTMRASRENYRRRVYCLCFIHLLMPVQAARRLKATISRSSYLSQVSSPLKEYHGAFCAPQWPAGGLRHALPGELCSSGASSHRSLKFARSTRRIATALALPSRARRSGPTPRMGALFTKQRADQHALAEAAFLRVVEICPGAKIRHNVLRPTGSTPKMEQCAS